MNPREAAHDDGGAAEETRRERGVLAARALTVVRITDDHSLDALRLVVARDRRERLPGLSRQDVLFLAGRAHEHVVAELAEVAEVAQPGSGGRDVVGGGLALAFRSMACP